MILTVTPTISTSAYTAGDQVGTILTVDGLGPGSHVLRGISALDKAKQKAAFNVILFKTLPTVASADNAAADVSDAQVVAHCIGQVAVAAGDYTDLNGSSVATKVLTGQPIETDQNGKFYALIVTSGTPTYGSTSDLVLKFLFD